MKTTNDYYDLHSDLNAKEYNNSYIHIKNFKKFMKEGLVIKESKNYDKFNFEKLHEGFMKYLGDL